MTDWQPIDTAPKDGTYITVYPPTWNGVVSCARWDEDSYSKRPRPFWNRTDSHQQVTISRSRTPTHWMPAPPPPPEQKS